MSAQADNGRVPPHSEEAERAVLGALMIDPVRIADVNDALQAEDFFGGRHGAIYQALLDLADKGIGIDFVSVGERLLSEQQLQKAGGREYLIELANGVTSSAHLAQNVKYVTETAALRRLIHEASDIITEAYETRPDGESVRELIDRSEHSIFKISDERGSNEASPLTVALEETFRRIDSSSQRGELTGVPCGYYDLDEMLCGFNAGDLIIIAARPSMGKTAFVLNVMEHAAMNPPKWMDHSPVVLFFSLEMGKLSIGSRMLCSRAEVDAHKLRTGNIPHEDYQRLSHAVGELANTKIFIDDSPGISVMSMRSRSRRVRARHGALDLVVVDYLQLMTHPKAESRQVEISQISRSLKELARELEVPVVALSQLSRAVESRDDKKPQLSDLRESGSIEQDADVVLLLYRPEYYFRDNEELRGLAEILVAKQRNGPTGEVKLNFVGSYMRFMNRAPSVAESIV